MKVQITVTNDEGEVDFSHTYEPVEFFEIGAYTPLRFDVSGQRGIWKQDAIRTGFHGAHITLVLRGNLPDNLKPKMKVIAPIDPP